MEKPTEPYIERNYSPKLAKKEELRLKAESKTLTASIQIGKNGITGELIEQVKSALKKKKLIKVRMLQSFIEGHNKNLSAAELAERCGASLVDLTGFIITLYRK